MIPRSVARRRAVPTITPRPPEVYECGRLRINFDTYEVFLDDRHVHLSLCDFALLRFFVRAERRVYTRAQIVQRVWAPDTHVAPRTVDSHVHRLRLQLERDPGQPDLFVTVRGVGYRFDDRALTNEPAPREP